MAQRTGEIQQGLDASHILYTGRQYELAHIGKEWRPWPMVAKAALP
jgi:hypothetical protein